MNNLSEKLASNFFSSSKVLLRGALNPGDRLPPSEFY